MASLWAWDVSALVYAKTYGPLAHSLDEDVLRYIGGSGEKGRVAIDAGCGPGVVARKLVEAGFAKVICADVSVGMLDQVGDDPRLLKVRTEIVPGSLKALASDHAPEGVDLILFKRSLYHPEDVAKEILKEATQVLKPGGVVIVVHPERRIVPYAFGRPVRVHRHTPYHLFNRVVSKLGVLLGGEHYNVYSRDELLALARASGGVVKPIPTTQSSFNMVAIGAAA